MKAIGLARHKGNRDRVIMVVLHVARLIDAVVYLGSMTLISSNLGMLFLLSDYID